MPTILPTPAYNSSGCSRSAASSSTKASRALSYVTLVQQAPFTSSSPLSPSAFCLCCGRLAPASLHSFLGATRSLLGAARARPCCSLWPQRTSDAQTNLRPPCIFPVAGSPLWQNPQPPATPASSCRSDPRGCVDALPAPRIARAPIFRPSNVVAGNALPLLLFVLFLAHAFLREARQEGPLVPPTLP